MCAVSKACQIELPEPCVFWLDDNWDAWLLLNSREFQGNINPENGIHAFMANMHMPTFYLEWHAFTANMHMIC